MLRTESRRIRMNGCMKGTLVMKLTLCRIIVAVLWNEKKAVVV
jgi:hypothetical protein